MSNAPEVQHALVSETETIPVEQRSCDYVFDRDILAVNGVISFGPRLIEVAERINLWTRATVVHGDKTTYGAERNNDSVVVAGHVHKELAYYEYLLCQAIHSCAYVYRSLNKHLWLKRDTGVSLLRYGPGQHFHEHVDTLSTSGGGIDGMRALSCVAFMNDGFEGGELVFPRHNIRIVPKAGTVVLFPSIFTHPHASTDIVKGVKYSVASWFVN